MPLPTDASNRARADREVLVRLAAPEELAEVLRVQHSGFRRVARRFGFSDSDMPPLQEDLTELQALLMSGTRTFVAVTGGVSGRIVGTVRAHVRDDGVVEIGRLAVDDGYERRGVASTLMNALEASYADSQRFELFTGSEAVDALALYEHIGYRVFRIEEFPGWTRVWLGKDSAGATAPADAPLH